MQAFLDDQLLTECPSGIAGALEAGRLAAEQLGRLIVEVHADGKPLAQELLENPPEGNAGILQLKMISVQPGPFMRTTLLDASELLGPIRRDQAEAAGLLQTGHVEEAFEPLQRALTAWSILRDLIEKSQMLGLTDPARVVVKGADWSTGKAGGEYIAELGDHLAEVKRTLELQDFTALADVLEGDLTTDAHAWEDFLRAMADQSGGAS